MPKVFYEIFNKNLNISEKVIKEFLKELEELFVKLQEDKDVDNLKVLKNRIELLVDKKPKKLNKERKKEYKLLSELAERIEDYIEEIEAEEKCCLVDVIGEVEKQYKKCKNIKEEKRDKYKEFCIKKSKISYEKELVKLQVELLKLQKYIKENNEKLLIIFEGRDAAGKWGTIKRFREYLNPRWARVVALEKPSEIERTQWYFQRYINHLPSGGEMTFFDRSWYNRGGVEPVMGFVSKGDYETFLEDAPKFEKMLVRSGIKLIKFYFSVKKEEQAARFDSRIHNPLKQYKLSPIDQFSQKLWDKYSIAEYHNFLNTHHSDAPWILINSDNKKKARINAIKYVLNQYDYPEKISDSELEVDKDLVYDWAKKVQKLKREIDLNVDLFE